MINCLTSRLRKPSWPSHTCTHSCAASRYDAIPLGLRSLQIRPEQIPVSYKHHRLEKYLYSTNVWCTERKLVMKQRSCFYNSLCPKIPSLMLWINLNDADFNREYYMIQNILLFCHIFYSYRFCLKCRLFILKFFHLGFYIKNVAIDFIYEYSLSFFGVWC